MNGLAFTTSTAAEKHTLMKSVDMLMNRGTNRSTAGNMTFNVTPCKKQVWRADIFCKNNGDTC